MLAAQSSTMRSPNCEPDFFFVRAKITGKRHEIVAMLQGGNGRARDFFVKNKTPMDGKINEKYTSRTASMYKQELLRSVADDMRKNAKLYTSGTASTTASMDTSKPAQKKVLALARLPCILEMLPLQLGVRLHAQFFQSTHLLVYLHFLPVFEIMFFLGGCVLSVDGASRVDSSLPRHAST
jgi:hypothetical protein